MSNRTVKRVSQSMPTLEGAGVRLRRAFGFGKTDDFDPFLLLDDFRGDSRFTTWAYKFALFEAAAAVRTRAWQGREIPTESDGWGRFASCGPTAQENLEMKELFATLKEAMATRLSAHQREVLVAVALNDVPIDVLAARLGKSHGAIYKTLHDARRKLRAAVEMGL